MSRLSKFLHLSNQLVQRNVFQNDVSQSPHWYGIAIRAATFSAARQNLAPGEVRARVFAPYSIFKGKASLSAIPIAPTFIKLESGHFRLDRRGVILLSFCPAIGDRKYDREKKKLFALSAGEVGSLISLGSKDSCEFFHDPSMQSSAAGQVRKSLSVKPQFDGSGYMISLTVVDNTLNTNERFLVPVTTAEFAVLRTAFSFALPHIMGWDKCTAQSPKDMLEKQLQLGSRELDSEWER